jgi:aerotaxis receptor
MTPEIDKLQHVLVMLIASQLSFQILIFLMIQYSFKKFVVNPLKGVEKRFEEVIEGDLNSNIGISGRDEIGILFCKLQVMQSQIQVMLDEMSLAASIIMDRTAVLNGKIGEVTKHSSNQRNDIRQISGVMEEFTKSVNQVAQDANNSAGAAITSQELIEKSNKKMDMTIQSTDKVVVAVRASSESINNLKDAIQKIGTVSNAIKEIADQTNLLALNAAIEAARAGEQGRGFAVVADEVRKLAERTGMSTNDIANMVGNIQAVSQSVVESMNEAIREVEAEAVIVQENGEILKQVIETSRQVTENAQRIAAVSKDQSVSSEGVSKNLENVAGLVNSNAQIAEDANLAAQELSKSAVALQSMINQLNRKT